MTRVFADTSYWIALLNPRDTLHARALAVSRKLKHMSIVTTELVLTELLNAFASKGEFLRARTCQLVDRITSALTADRDFQQAGFRALLLE